MISPPFKWYGHLTKNALLIILEHLWIFSILIKVKASGFLMSLKAFFNTGRLCDIESSSGIIFFNVRTFLVFRTNICELRCLVVNAWAHCSEWGTYFLFTWKKSLNAVPRHVCLSIHLWLGTDTFLSLYSYASRWPPAGKGICKCVKNPKSF